MTSETIYRQLGPVSARWMQDLGRGKKRHLIVDAEVDDFNARAVVSREAAIVRRKTKDDRSVSD